MIPFLKKKIYLTRSDEDNLNFQRYFNLVQKKVDARELFESIPLLNILFIKLSAFGKNTNSFAPGFV